MKKILVIEDNQDIRENAAEILELSHYKVFTAENGLNGIEIALAQKPDLILCDIMMPEMDGYGVLHMVQKNPDLKATPFIFFSAKTEQSDIRRGMGLGADDYIPKPFSATDLLTTVESRLKKTELLKENIEAGLKGFNQLLSISNGKNVLQEFLEGRHTNKYKKKQVIYNEGNRPTRLFYVQKGKVKTFKISETGKELVVNLYSEGDFFGYTDLLDGGSYTTTAAALEDAEIAEIPKEEFEQLMNSNREVSQKFIQLLAKNIKDKEIQLVNIAYNSLRKKVADALVMLINKYQKKLDGRPIVDISRENLATIAGTATESLIRTLADFKSEKLIDIKDGHIVILNEKKLSQMLN